MKNITMISILLLTISTLIIGCNDPEMNDPIDNDPVEMDGCDKLFPPQDTVILSHTAFTRTHYPTRIKVFQADTIAEGDIVMLGNSLTEQGGNWNVKLDRTNVKNRGIAGDNTDGVTARLNELICKKPSVVFILIGTNDLFISFGPERISKNIHSIGDTLATKLPESRIIIQTIMPLGLGHDKKSKLLEINDLLKGMGNREYELLDTYQHMANESGDLPSEHTYDGVHLTPDGYAKWVAFLKTNL